MKFDVGRAAMLLVALLAAPSIAWAQQAWPTKPVKIVAPFAAGGNVDVTARIVAEQLQRLLGQPVIVENKTAAGSMIASEAVARSAPDGYTLLMTSASLTNSPALFGRYPYDWQKDFAFITAVSFQPLVLLVNPAMSAKDFASFLAVARSEPLVDRINVRSARPAITVAQHLGAEYPGDLCRILRNCVFGAILKKQNL